MTAVGYYRDIQCWLVSCLGGLGCVGRLGFSGTRLTNRTVEQVQLNSIAGPCSRANIFTKNNSNLAKRESQIPVLSCSLQTTFQNPSPYELHTTSSTLGVSKTVMVIVW